MEGTNQQPSFAFQPSPRKSGWLYSPGNVFIIYTALVILLTIKNRFGLESMMEFMGKYLKSVDNVYPELNSAVCGAVKMVGIDKIFHEAMSTYEK